jgi:transposase
MKQENRRVAVEPERVSRNGKRFFSAAYKRAIVEKCLVAGASVSAVALAHGFNTNLVRKWIDKCKTERGSVGASTALVPVKVIAAPRKSTSKPARRAGAKACGVTSGWIEVEIGAARLIVRGQVEASQLRAVLDALGVWR